MDKLPDPIAYAIPMFIIMIIAEMIIAKRAAPERYEPKDTLSSLAFGLGSNVAGLIFGGIVFGLSLQVYALSP